MEICKQQSEIKMRHLPAVDRFASVIYASWAATPPRNDIHHNIFNLQNDNINMGHMLRDENADERS